MIALFGAAGARPPKVRVAGKTMLRLVGLFSPMMREMVEMHDLLNSYEEGPRRTLQTQREESVHAR